MARSLLETIKANQRNAGAPNQQPAQPNMQQDIQQTLAAKSGRAAAGPMGPRASSIQQKAAQAQTQAGLQQVQQQGQIAASAVGQQQAAQQQQYDQQLADAQQRIKFQADDMNRRTTEILNNIERNQKELDNQQKLAGFEQAGFLLGLQNDKYLQELTQTAKLKRLDNELAFDQELQKSMLEDDWDLYKNNIDFQKLLDMDQRQFEIEMKDMSIDDAYQAWKREMTAQQIRSVFGGMSKGGSAAADYAAKEKASTPQETGASDTSSRRGESSYGGSTTYGSNTAEA